MMDPEFFLRCLPPVAATAIGASVGSFLNVCIYRIPIGLTVTKPKRSFCPSCHVQIKAVDNIPVISWLLLGGRCRFCDGPIPAWYFLVEIFAAAGSGIACLKSGLPGAALFLIVYSLLIYAIRTARRAGYSSSLGFLILPFVLAGVIYFQREAAQWTNCWKLALCCLGTILILRTGYSLSVNQWNKRLIVFSAALAGGWLGALGAAAIWMAVGKRSPDAEDAILLACISVGPIFS